MEYLDLKLESKGGERKLRGGEDDEEGDDDEQEAKRGLSLHDCEKKKTRW